MEAIGVNQLLCDGMPFGLESRQNTAVQLFLDYASKLPSEIIGVPRQQPLAFNTALDRENGDLLHANVHNQDIYCRLGSGHFALIIAFLPYKDDTGNDAR